jgi:replicative DNA helicase
MGDGASRFVAQDAQLPSVQSFDEIVADLDSRVSSGDLQKFKAIPTGFEELDLAISGGLRSGQLLLLSGQAGIGKTSLTMQIARNIASAHQAVCLYVCYEHDTDYLAQRLISLESIDKGDGLPSDGLRLKDIADLVSSSSKAPRQEGTNDFIGALSQDARGARALQRIKKYSGELFFIKGTASTGLEALASAVSQVRAPGGAAEGRPVVLFVDYLQKIAAATPHTEEAARNVEEVEGLKEIALRQGAVVVAIAAAQAAGLKAQRLRMEHLLASAELAYEADVIITMNEKYDVVDRQHIEFNRYNANTFHRYVVLSIEKNRMGSDLIDIEIRKQLQFCRFRTDARRVQEALISGPNKSMSE